MQIESALRIYYAIKADFDDRGELAQKNTLSDVLFVTPIPYFLR